MAHEIRQYSAAVAAGTPRTAPASFSLAMPAREVVQVDILVPPGAAGNVGFALAVSGVTVIPYNSDAFIIASGETLSWPLAGYPNSGDWSLKAFNTGRNQHTIYVRFLLDLVAPPGPPPPPQLPDLSALTSYNAEQVSLLTAQSEAAV